MPAYLAEADELHLGIREGLDVSLVNPARITANSGDPVHSRVAQVVVELVGVVLHDSPHALDLGH